MTNSVLEAIKGRKSTRAYESKPVSKDILRTIIEAGNQAPCMADVDEDGLSQPWRFVVVEDREFKKKLLQVAFPLWRQFIESLKDSDPKNYGDVMKVYDAMEEPKDMVYYSAPAIIFVIGKTEQAVSCALACENMMIAAQSLGLGSCYVGFGSMVKGDASIIQALGLKENERIYGPILLGYPKDVAAANALRWKKKDPVVKWI